MKKTHNQLIIKHLQRGHSITHLTALSRYRCARIAARINELRGDGWRIATKMVSRNGARYASYSLP
jgi:hypothetical protein